MPPLADKIELCERFTYLNALQIVRRGHIEMLEDRGIGEPKETDPKRLRSLEQIDWEPALRNGNRWYDRVVAAMRLKDRAGRKRELDKISDDLQALKQDLLQTDIPKILSGKERPDKKAGQGIGNVFLTMLLPPCRKWQDSYDRFEQVQRNLHIAFALAAYQREQGRYPAKLDELTPKYLSAIPADVFSGKPLIYRPSEKGYLLYSVGVNGKDENGRGYDDDPQGDDLAVRMPLPELKQDK